ncbi:extracellular solute-binding protein [Brytella acorum]|uniref:Extracellular solute-binding protein n=1 Tax=Brytella acorum TaxID=2959299 RepID=A0AA35UY99_9PROT|nr:extracellular solute-binding protein [Brytella acorum]MDF3623781.1 extracellular solute-binding protein [Brytella acorum]CAI9121809.1 extracellular solute-binding protein [Brytella acorum]
MSRPIPHQHRTGPLPRLPLKTSKRKRRAVAASLVLLGLSIAGIHNTMHGGHATSYRGHARHINRSHVAGSSKAQTREPVLAVLAQVIEANALATPDQPFVLKDWDGQLETLRRKNQLRRPEWSAVMLDDQTLRVACRDGLVLPLPAPASGTPDQTESSCGIDGGHISTVLAWDTARLSAGFVPDWSTLWDIARHPGKRGLRMDPRTTLEIALLADGVAPEAVYTTLSTPDGVDRAFRKLDQLRPYIVWWRTPDDAARIMLTGAALITSAPADSVTVAQRKSAFSPRWSQTLRQNISWAIPQNVPADIAAPVVSMLRELRPHHDEPHDPGIAETHALTMDDAFWSVNGDALQKRFQAWINAPG